MTRLLYDIDDYLEDAPHTGRVPGWDSAAGAASPVATCSNGGLRISPITALRRLTISAFSCATE